MDEAQRRLLQCNRLQFVTNLEVAPLWDLLLQKEIFSQDMIEEIQSAGTRRDQARALITDLQTRGRQALPLFLACLEETGQNELASILKEGCRNQTGGPLQVNPVKMHKPDEKKSSGENRIKELKRNADKDFILTADPCGHCLIINNVDFLEHTNLSRRDGSDIDCEKLERRFRSFHFDVLVQRNLKGQEIHSELQKLAGKDHSHLDCCLVVILSHGCESRHIQFPGGVYGTDGIPIPVERIVKYFDGFQCPSLRGKPKLFIIQACGGEQKDKGFELDSGAESPTNGQGDSVQSDATPFNVSAGSFDQLDAVASLPTPSDILVAYSTFPGFVSWRDKQTGSWYVETLDSVLGQDAASEDLQALLVMVANQVSAKGVYKQIPGYFNYLRKRFFFMTS
ncbi:caspase-9 isoform X2 [Microcaecilia unicolor]|uniref:Caspase-9 n=1 Tax=Microcaecilia unicolor TaxID=1415580 RepID=A0A6P7WN69_9AMPH|nr:caspase-9 isoform X2 [Microcaecilia unicolor]